MTSLEEVIDGLQLELDDAAADRVLSELRALPEARMRELVQRLEEARRDAANREALADLAFALAVVALRRGISGGVL